MLPHFHKQARITVHPRYVVKYLGCCDSTVNEDTEDDYRAKFLEILQDTQVKTHDLKKMILTITERGMSIKCPKLEKEYFFPVHQIGSCGRVEEFEKAFLFTYRPKDWKSEIHLECHAVLCASKESSIELKDAISWMFKAAFLTQKHRIHEEEIAEIKPTYSLTPQMKRKQKPPLNRSSSVL